MSDPITLVPIRPLPEFLSHGIYRCGETGAILPSVTAVLALTTDNPFPAAKRAQEFRARAADRGRLVHDLTAEFDAVGFYANDPPDPLRPFCRAWEEFRRCVSWQPVLIEQAVTDHLRRFACRIDRLMYMPLDKCWVVVEIKSTLNEDDWDIQTVAQTLAIASSYGLPWPMERAAVSITGDGKFKVHRYSIHLAESAARIWDARLLKFNDHHLEKYLDDRFHPFMAALAAKAEEEDDAGAGNQ